jgi:hypothetical protein
LGVGIATITDLQLNALGSFLSILAIITTCVAQIVSLKKIPLLFAAQNFNITLNIFCKDFVCLLCTAFVCTTDKQNLYKKYFNTTLNFLMINMLLIT